jgi:chromosome segregation ATPase
VHLSDLAKAAAKASMEAENIALRKKLAQAIRSLKTYREFRDKTEAKITALHKEVEAKRLAFDNVQSSSESEIESARFESTRLEEDFRSKLNVLKLSKDNLQKKAMDLVAQCDELRRAVADSSRAEDRVKAQLSLSQSQCVQQRGDREAERTQLQSSIGVLKSAMIDSAVQLNSFRCLLDGRSGVVGIQSLQVECDGLGHQIDLHLEETTSAESRLNTRIDGLVQSESDLKLEVHKSTEQIGDLRENLDSAAVQLKNRDEQLSLLNRESEDRIDEMRVVRSELKTKLDYLVAAESEIQSLKCRTEKLSKTCDVLQTEIDNREKEYEAVCDLNC